MLLIRMPETFRTYSYALDVLLVHMDVMVSQSRFLTLFDFLIQVAESLVLCNSTGTLPN